MSEKRKINWWLVWILSVVGLMVLKGFEKQNQGPSAHLDDPFPKNIESNLTAQCKKEFSDSTSIEKCQTDINFYLAHVFKPIEDKISLGLMNIDSKTKALLEKPIGNVSGHKAATKVNKITNFNPLLLNEWMSLSEYQQVKNDLEKKYLISGVIGFLNFFQNGNFHAKIQPKYDYDEADSKSKLYFGGINIQQSKLADSLKNLQELCDTFDLNGLRLKTAIHPCYGAFLIKFSVNMDAERIEPKADLLGFQIRLNNILDLRSNLTEIERRKLQKLYKNHEVLSCYNKFFKFHYDKGEERYLSDEEVFFLECPDNLFATSYLVAPLENFVTISQNKMDELKAKAEEKLLTDNKCEGDLRHVQRIYAAKILKFPNYREREEFKKAIKRNGEARVASSSKDDYVQFLHIYRCLSS